MITRGVSITSISPELMGLFYPKETEQDELKRRLNARWKLHQDPDAGHVAVVKPEHGQPITGTVKHGQQAPNGDYTAEFTPAPRKGDPSYYLENR